MSCPRVYKWYRCVPKRGCAFFKSSNFLLERTDVSLFYRRDRRLSSAVRICAHTTMRSATSPHTRTCKISPAKCLQMYFPLAGDAISGLDVEALHGARRGEFDGIRARVVPVKTNVSISMHIVRSFRAGRTHGQSSRHAQRDLCTIELLRWFCEGQVREVHIENGFTHRVNMVRGCNI